MGVGKNHRRSATSSSDSEDGDADWITAIDSIASTTTFTSSTANSNGTGVPYFLNRQAKTDSPAVEPTVADKDKIHKPQNLKHYQIKAQKHLNEILERTIEVVSYTDQQSLDKEPTTSEGFRLFKHAPRGTSFDHDEIEGPKKKPRILPGEEMDEKSNKFRKQLQSVAVDGEVIIAAAMVARQKSLSKVEAREAAKREAAKREEERVAKTKSIRGERWLPSMAREMQANTQRAR